MKYCFVVQELSGKTRVGTMEVESEEELIEMLRARGMIVKDMWQPGEAGVRLNIASSGNKGESSLSGSTLPGKGHKDTLFVRFLASVACNFRGAAIERFTAIVFRKASGDPLSELKLWKNRMKVS